MGQFTDAVDATTFTEQVAFAVGGFFLLFFVISPIVGMLIHRWIRKRATWVFIACVVTFLIQVLTIGLFYILRFRFFIPLPDIPLLLLCGTFALVASLLSGRYLAWWLDGEEKSLLQVEFESLTEEEMLPFDHRKRAHLKRRDKARGYK